MKWRPYDPEADRAEAHETLRGLIRDGVLAPHPGEFDWMYFHRDPRYDFAFLVDDGAVAIVASKDDYRIVDAYGLPVEDQIALGAERFGANDFKVAHALSDADAVALLEARGFTLQPHPDPIFLRPTAGAVAHPLPAGFSFRSVRGEEDADKRAPAARRAFNTDMDPASHTARYRRFMQSPAYDAEHDVVVVTSDDRVAAFTIYWVDEELSLAQFEPVGTDPDFQRRGLARALITHVLARLDALGIRDARVMTNGDNNAAIATYSSCGFEIVDRLGWWKGSVG